MDTACRTYALRFIDEQILVRPSKQEHNTAGISTTIVIAPTLPLGGEQRIGLEQRCFPESRSVLSGCLASVYLRLWAACRCAEGALTRRPGCFIRT